MHLITGLGNPGRTYHLTRHNIGFEVIDYLAERYGLTAKSKFRGNYYTHTLYGQKLMLLKPQTYMNLSGTCVYDFAHYFNIDPGNVVVIYDDSAFAPGVVRIRKSGSGGGHNGMDNIIYHLQTEQIPRIRIGIGQAEYALKNHVLSRFTPEEVPLMRDAVVTAAKAIDCILSDGVDRAMNTYNRKSDPVDE